VSTLIERIRSRSAAGRVSAALVVGVVIAVAFTIAALAEGNDFIAAVLRGISFGSVYALLAVGLVVTYRTTGVFNLAFGPQAFFAAAVYYDTHVTHGWPIWLAAIWTIGIVSPLLGILLDRFLFRFLRTASETAKLVTVLGLFVAVPAIVWLWFGQDLRTDGTGIIPNGSTTYEVFKDVFISRDDMAIMACAIGVLVALVLVFRYTAFGLRMRAVVESPRLTELAGVDADRVSMGSWALSSAIAGLAGVLLVPVFAGQVDYTYFERLTIAAIAAVVIGQLGSVPLAFFGGLALGVTQQLLDKYLPTNSFFASTLRPALPFVVGFAVLVLSPALARRTAPADPLAGVDPPPPALAADDRPAWLTKATRGFGVAIFCVVGYWLFFHANDSWIDLSVRAAILGVIFLSITVITGFAGQLSLCQAAFAAIGSAATAQLAIAQGMSVLVAMVIGAFIAAAVGALVALPVLRLGGVFLALATLSFAFFFDAVILQFGWVGGGTAVLETPRPQIGSIDFGNGHDRAFLVLTLIVLAIVSMLVIWVRNGTTGRSLDAIRGSEVASASIGINRNRAKIMAFALSAGIAGLGGGLMVTYTHGGSASTIQANFAPEFGLVWIVLVVTLGARTIEGALNAAFGFVFFAAVILPTWIPWLVNLQPWYHMSSLPLGLQTVLFGLGALTFAKHPEGILEYNKRKSYETMNKVGGRFGRPSSPSTSTPTPSDVTPATAGSAQ
jgi:branched-subunit amino acid ABC-type transport system permease component